MKHTTSVCHSHLLTIPLALPAVVAAIVFGLVTVVGTHAEPVKPGTAKKGCAITLQGPGAGQSVVYEDGYSFSIVDKATGKTHTYTCNDGVWTETVSKTSAPLGGVKPVLVNAIGIRASKEEVNRACDAIKGVPNLGSNGAGYGCYKPKTDVMVICRSDGACIGFTPLHTRAKTLRGLLGLDRVQVEPDAGGAGFEQGGGPPPSDGGIIL